MDLLKGKALTDAITTLGKSNKELVKLVHRLAVSALVEVVVTKNTNACNRLAKAVANVGARQVLMWMQSNGAVTWDNKAKAFKLNATKRDAFEAEGEGVYEARMIKSKAYYLTNPDTAKEFNGFDTIKLLRSIVKREGKLKPEQRTHENNKIVGLDRIAELADALEAELESGSDTEAEAPAPVEAKVSRRRSTTAVETATTIQ